jgi:hypothetical protein
MDKPKVTYEISVDTDDTPIHGNAQASGDDEDDTCAENDILSRLRHGDIWAWASVTVLATCGEFSGSNSLGCCSYKDQDEFEKDQYYKDMKAEALEDLRRNLLSAVKRGEAASKLLARLGGKAK